MLPLLSLLQVTHVKMASCLHWCVPPCLLSRPRWPWSSFYLFLWIQPQRSASFQDSTQWVSSLSPCVMWSACWFSDSLWLLLRSQWRTPSVISAAETDFVFQWCFCHICQHVCLSCYYCLKKIQWGAFSFEAMSSILFFHVFLPNTLSHSCA